MESANHPILLETERQLAEYFAGERTEFSIRLDLTGTAFQKAVWQALLTIPFGENPDLCRHCPADRAPQSLSRDGGGKRQKPGIDHRPLPPRDRIGTGSCTVLPAGWRPSDICWHWNASA